MAARKIGAPTLRAGSGPDGGAHRGPRAVLADGQGGHAVARAAEGVLRPRGQGRQV